MRLTQLAEVCRLRAMRRWLISFLCAVWLFIRQVQDVLGVGTMLDDGKTLWGHVVAIGKVIDFTTVDWLLLVMVGGLIFGPRPRIVKHVRRLAGRIGRVSYRLSQTDVSQFDTPILVAINQLIRTAPHSYTRSDWAERNAFTALHEKMCSGQLAVIGKESDFTAPRRIIARECKRLEPREVGVIPTASAPDGARFSLCSPHTDQDNERLEMCDLRVRSRDLYRVWPRISGPAASIPEQTGLSHG